MSRRGAAGRAIGSRPEATFLLRSTPDSLTWAKKKIQQHFTSTKEARRRNGLETGNEGSHDVRKR
jgi:hypothetical protein